MSIDQQKMRSAFSHAAQTYDKVAILQREVGDSLFSRLDLFKISPQSILDLGAGTGYFTRKLAKHYRKAKVFGLDIAFGMSEKAKQQTGWLSKQKFICANALHLPLADQSMDLIFSNLVLHWIEDLDQVFSEIQRVLKPGGVLLFSTLGPDTLKELRQSWQQVDDLAHVNRFFDMHDVGDGLLRNRLIDPVMDMDYFTLTYDKAIDLMRDLKALGAHNVNAARSRQLTGKGSLQKMIGHYEQYRENDLLPATYEVVYGHAWGTEKKTEEPGMIKIPIDSIKRFQR